MGKTKSQEAGTMYYEAMRAVKNGGDSLWLLAQHIKQMVKGTSEYPGPLWQVRELEPDGRIVELEKFADYLFLPPREGLGIPGYHFLNNVLDSSKDGPEALAIIRKEIPDYDERLAEDRRKHGAVKAVENPLKEHGNGPGRGNKRDDNGNSFSMGSNKADYLLARLARDHPDILSDYELGRYKSVRAAAIAAGIIKVQSPYEMIGKQLAKLNRLELMDLQARITAILQEQ